MCLLGIRLGCSGVSTGTREVRGWPTGATWGSMRTGKRYARRGVMNLITPSAVSHAVPSRDSTTLTVLSAEWHRRAGSATGASEGIWDPRPSYSTPDFGLAVGGCAARPTQNVTDTDIDTLAFREGEWTVRSLFLLPRPG